MRPAAERRGRVARHRPEDQRVGRDDDEEGPEHGTLAEAHGLGGDVSEPPAALREPVDRPAREAEHAQFLGRGRVDREAVGVVGVALVLPDLVVVPALPHRALAEEDVGRQPRAADQHGRPPPVGREHQRGAETATQLGEAVPDEVDAQRQGGTGDAEVEVPRQGELVGERRGLEVGHPAGLEAGPHQTFVQPSRNLRPKVVADLLVDRAQHLQKNEGNAELDEPGAQRRVTLDGGDERADGHGQRRRQERSQNYQAPPHAGEDAVGAPHGAEQQLPLRRFPQLLHSVDPIDRRREIPSR